jgi:uncharacterized protein YpbB
MPPFAGTATELEALVQLLSWMAAGEPQAWPVSDDHDAVERIQRWLNEAGTEAGHASQRVSVKERHP